LIPFLNGFQVCPCLVDGDIPFEASDHADQAHPLSLTFGFQVESQRHQQLDTGLLGKTEAGGQDPDHRVAFTVKQQCLANQVGICSKPTVPEALGDHDYMVLAWPVLFVQEGPPDGWSNP
jgi:hypothetical protein